MYQEENEFYEPYQWKYEPSPASVAVLDTPSTTQPLPEQAVSQPPQYPSGPLPTATAPHRRPGQPVIIILLLAIILGAGLFTAGWQFASHSSTASTSVSEIAKTTATSSTTAQTQQEAAIAKVEPAVVELKVTTSQGQQIGSGVIIDSKGDIVTNNHVVDGAQNITVVLNNGTKESAQLVGNDAANDLAVIRIAPFAHMVVAQIGDSSKLTVGQEVLAIGNPLGITETATNGIISALNRSVQESASITISNAIQTDASINPGNSGGALINLQGQLVGIPTLGAVNTESNTPANGIGFAIPSNTVATVVQQLLRQAQ